MKETGVAGMVAPSIGRLDEVVERVAPRGVDPVGWPLLVRGRRASVSRAKQLRATVRQLERAVSHPDMDPQAATDVEVLLSPECVDVFMELAWSGVLRDPARAAVMGRSLSTAQMATIRDCLKILGEELGVEMLLPRMGQEPPADPVSPAQGAALRRRLADMAAAAPLGARLSRSLAVLSVILDTGMQTAGVTSRRLDDLDLDGGRLRCVYRPQNTTHLGEVTDTLPLADGTVVALRRWLRFRQELVDGLEGSDHGALWVTVQAASVPRPDGSWAAYAAGMPLHESGLRLAHEDAVDELNSVMAGLWDGPGRWRPVTRCPEQLRRSVDAAALVPELAARLPDPRPQRVFGLVHGTQGGYGNHKCRCRRCRKAHARYQAGWRERARAEAAEASAAEG